MSNLDNQIAENARKINTTEYRMFIGEVIKLNTLEEL